MGCVFCRVGFLCACLKVGEGLVFDLLGLHGRCVFWVVLRACLGW